MKKITTNKKIVLLVVFGLLLRLFLMFNTRHTDLWAFVLSENIFVNKGVTNIYNYLGNLPKDDPINLNYGANFFTYPPLTYFTFGVFGWFLAPLYGGNFLATLAEKLPQIAYNSNYNFQTFLGKFPLLIFDFGILFVLWKYFYPDKAKQYKAVFLWMFNPLSLYSSFMVGQFDVIPVFFVVLSLLMLKNNKDNLSALFLGIGGAYKMFPLFFLPFLIFNKTRNLKEKIILVFWGSAPFVLSILPFIKSMYFRQTVLLSNQTQKMLFAKINVSGAEYLSLFIIFYLVLLIASSFLKKNLSVWYLFVMLLFFSVTHYHPQWFLWLAPLLLIYSVNNKLKAIPTILYIFWLIITLFFENSLSIGLFAPLSNQLAGFGGISVLIEKFYDVFQFKSIIRSLFAGIFLAMFFKSSRSSNEEV